MTITNGYATLAEYKAFAEINSTDAADDAVTEAIIEAMSRAIDQVCRRRFWTATETRYYTAGSPSIVFIDDLGSTSSLAVYTDDDGDGTFENTLATTDYQVEPINASIEGWPYTWIERKINGNYSFPLVQNGVKITGAFGWAAVPKPIHEACLMGVKWLYDKRSGEGQSDSARVTAAGIVLTPSGLPKAVTQLIQPYKRVI